MNFTIYKSSAGSGKTYTLVREYLRICLSDENVNNFKTILAITFTNKAAAEMKERVFSALKGIAESTEKYNALTLELQTILNTDTKVVRQRAKSVLDVMLHNYGAVGISTIDKFVYKIVKNFARDLQLPADFEIELDADVLLKQAIEQVLAQVGTNELLTNFLYEFTETRAGNEQNWNIENDILKFAKNLLTDESIFYLNQINSLSLNNFLVIKDNLNKLSEVAETTAKAIGVEALNAIEGINIEASSFAYGGRIIQFFKKLTSSTLADEDFDSLKQVTSIVDNNKHTSTKASKIDIAAIDGIAPLLNKLFYDALELVEKDFPKYYLYSIVKKNIFQLALLNEINNAMQVIKDEHKQVHISEFNKLIANVVVNEPAPFIYERLGERYNHFLIDEFQDTSIIQFQNLLPLIENSLATGGFNLLVGDGKQSIYRWRGGEIEQFIKLPQLINSNNNVLLREKERSIERNFLEKNLMKNFRSQRQIIEFNNLFFGFLKSKLPNTLQSIYDNHEQEFNPDLNKGYVQLQTFDVEALEAEEVDDMYCNLVIEKIANCVQNGYSFSDIAIIVRKNKHGNLLAEYLTANKIPVVSKESLLLKNNDAVLFLVNCFTLLHQPTNQLVKLAIVQFISSHNNKVVTINKELVELVSTLGFDELFAHFNIQLSTSSLLTFPMYESAELICRACNLVDESNAYLVYFLDNLLQYTQKTGASFNGFLQWWEDNKHKLSVSVPEGVNAVSILTIHKSKGLEFPVVIVPYSNWLVEQGQDYFWLKLDLPELPSLKTALVSSNKTLKKTPFAQVYDDEKSKQILDSVNMLYVAFTRAEQQLYIIAEKPHKQKKLSQYFVDFIDAMNKDGDSENTYLMGMQHPPVKTNKTMVNVFQVPFVSVDWREKISVV